MTLADDLRALGQVQAARDLDQNTLDRRRILGEDHPDTLTSRPFGPAPGQWQGSGKKRHILAGGHRVG